MIECKVTPWYFRRMGLLAAMLVIFAAFFLYDGKWGYPAKNLKADVKDHFETEVLKGYDKAKTAGTLDDWRDEMKSKGWPVDVDGEPPKWISYAAVHGIDEKPKRYTDREIDEQFWYGGGMLVVAVVVGLLVLMNKNKVLRGYEDRFIAPDGQEVRFADVFKVDTRKWKSKGLASVFYKAGGTGAERRAVIDCMKYEEQGAEAVLQRLLSGFRGELIEKIEEPEEEDEESAPQS